ncbi:alkaline phosphatase family protein [Halostella litorea]|uniref:alkaline phosphatase family protein n=1 Tax=Halostella litorea TaxID=2528831 RepID=UPI0010920250|nr:alkaline phosphatase family protein [Halostella litorea]
MTTVVLGWDGLDAELVEAFGLGGAFGAHGHRIDTFDNPVLGKPHTYELWPSIVTGAPPAEHGVHAATDDEGVAWGNPAIAATARLARRVVPEQLRTRVGAALRQRGAGLDFKTADWYRERGVDTVFDGRTARAVTVPNYVTERDRRLGLDADRGAALGDFLAVGEGDDEGTVHAPRVSVPELEERLVGEATEKLGVVRACAQREYDIVFVWLGYLDTVGHLAPVVDESGWQERGYRLAAALTGEVADALAPDDALVCVSDHGLRDGDHTHDAYLAADDPAAVRGVESVLDVREGIERVTPASGERTDPPVRERFRGEGSAASQDAAEVRDQLEDLGYL